MPGSNSRLSEASRTHGSVRMQSSSEIHMASRPDTTRSTNAAKIGVNNPSASSPLNRPAASQG